MLITPTRHDYARLRASQLVPVELNQARVPQTASQEWRLHQAIYVARPDVGAVVHTHSPYATAWGCAPASALPQLEEFEYLRIGPIRTVAHDRGGSEALARATAGGLGTSRAVLLAWHGLVAVGDAPASALAVAEAVEHVAHVGWVMRGAVGPEPVEETAACVCLPISQVALVSDSSGRRPSARSSIGR